MRDDTPAHVDHLMDDYFNELLGDEDTALVEEHCRGCAECRALLQQARRRQNVLESLPGVEASERLIRATLDHVGAFDTRRRAFRRRVAFGFVAAMAASVLALLGAGYHYSHLPTVRYDVVLLGQERLTADSRAALRVRVLDRKTQAPVAMQVPVVVTLKKRDGTEEKELARGTTDATGSLAPQVNVPDWEAGGYTMFVSAELPSGEETLSRPVRLVRESRLMLSTDRPVYKPGQTILMRSLALRATDLKPVAGTNAVFTLADPRGTVLFKHAMPTSGFGIASAECPLDPEVAEGTYTLACKVGSTESKQAVEVKNYVLPPFKLVATADRPYYAPGMTGKLAVRADYFFGKPVAGATVTVVPPAEAVTLAPPRILTAKTDADGKAEIDFVVPDKMAGTPRDDGDARLPLTVEVVDAAGQKVSRLVEPPVTNRPIKVAVLAEAGSLVLQQANTVFVLAHRIDGSPLGGVTAKIDGTDIAATVTLDEHGVGSFTVTPTATELPYTLGLFDKAGNVLTRQAGKLRVGEVFGDFLVRTDKPTYKGGETIRVTAVGGNSVEPIFLDLVRDGQTFSSHTIELASGKGEAAFDLPPDLQGTIRLSAYRFVGPYAQPRRKQRVIQVDPASQLKITATLDAAEYRPGKTARLSLGLRDEQGRAVIGAVSLAAVDEAVFSVLPTRPGLERAFYTLDAEALKPAATVYPWSDDVPRPEAVERAALAATATDFVPEQSRANTLSPAGVHTLAASSLPQRRMERDARAASGMRIVEKGWILVGFVTLLGLYAGLWLFQTPEVVLKIHGVAAIAVVAVVVCLLPVLVFSPEARRTFDSVAGMAPSAAAKDKSDAKGPPRGSEDGPGDVRVRKDFPETLLWKPELLTDDNGNIAPLDITLADSITTWRLTAGAVSADGRVGGLQMPLKVFQPFFVDVQMPTQLTRGDAVSLGVTVYNYLDKEQSVEVRLPPQAWFALNAPQTQTVKLGPGEVRAVRFAIAANKVGLNDIEVGARAGSVADAVRRRIDVVPDGRRVETASSGTLDAATTLALNVPPGVIDGSVRATLKLYPSGFSQVVEGIDGIFRMPTGCFEQTSSALYPNVLALDYLRRNGLKNPEVEAKARQYIHLGYQRLVGFEVPGGGFDWYGRAPANEVLSAYGLMEFEDMARVHDVDPAIIDRTRNWLLSKRQPDGGWASSERTTHLSGSGSLEVDTARLATSAYIASAVFSGGKFGDRAELTRAHLLATTAGEIGDVHTLALVCRALQAMETPAHEVEPYLRRLGGLAKIEDDGTARWERATGRRTMFYGSGKAGDIETTALAALALMHAKSAPALTPKALLWLTKQKDPRGTWHSTQATVLALQALLAGTNPADANAARRVEVTVGGKTKTIDIPAEQAEVTKFVDLTELLAPGENAVKLTETTKTAVGWQVVYRYHVPATNDKPAAESGPLSLELKYDRADLAVGDVLTATATVTNNRQTAAPMVMLDLPVPPGFAVETAGLDELAHKGVIGRYQVRPRQVLVYLRGVEPKKPVTVPYTLRATMPVTAATAPAASYEYYDPAVRAETPPGRVTVK